MSLLTVSSNRDFLQLFALPFVPKKYAYTIDSDFFKVGNTLCNVHRKQLTTEIDDESFLHNTLPSFRCGERGCEATFSTVHSYEIHYRTSHMNVCSECKQTFPTTDLLDCHILEKHDSFQKAIEMKGIPVYNCLLQNCNQTFQSAEDQKEHLIKFHKYPVNFKYVNLRKSKKGSEKMDISESNEVSNKRASQKGSVPRLPHTICFGRNATRGFHQKMINKSNKPSKFKKDCSDITMKELKEALE